MKDHAVAGDRDLGGDSADEVRPIDLVELIDFSGSIKEVVTGILLVVVDIFGRTNMPNHPDEIFISIESQHEIDVRNRIRENVEGSANSNEESDDLDRVVVGPDCASLGRGCTCEKL